MLITDPTHAQQLCWEFPLLRCHAGAPLGNGTIGLLVWGWDDELRITVARAGFWDRRGGRPDSVRSDFAAVRRLLEAGDHASLRAVLSGGGDGFTGLGGPHQLGGARIVIRLPANWRLHRVRVSDDGLLLVLAQGPDAQTAELKIACAAAGESAWIQVPQALAAARWTVLAAGELAADEWQRYGHPVPERQGDGERVCLRQSLPADAALGLRVQRSATANGAWRLELTTVLDCADLAAVAALPVLDHECLHAAAVAQGQRIHSERFAVSLPDPALNQALALALHRLEGATRAPGVACTLQGPWMEDHRVPPWSNDYHLNVNTELIYHAALVANLPDHTRPLWELLHAWLPRLQDNGRRFFGRDDALMLPHAVDDRCQTIGSFWTGVIDHGCTAWMALLAWWQHLHAPDQVFLRQTAWPLLRGALAGYEAMLEDDGHGGLRLPVSVSPEFRGSRPDAWGADASFQLAALHAVLQALPEAAAHLGETADPRWSALARRVPPYAVIDGERWREWPGTPARRIGLWVGQDLDLCHRHHSHLAGLWPFASYDAHDPAHAAIVRDSLHWWTQLGAGAWSGWCVPWAAILWARAGEADAWLHWLRHWHSAFTNEGGGTLHDAAFPGGSALHGRNFRHDARDAVHDEIFQLDAGMAAILAVGELLCRRQRDGCLRILPAGLPRGWRDLSWQRLRVPGGLLLDGMVAEGRLERLSVTATVAATVDLQDGQQRHRLTLRAGQRVELRPAER
jgi:hypothetical protein